MVLLTTLALFFFIGMASWIVGEIFNYPGVASIGAITIFITGSAIALTGLQVKTGELHETTATNDTAIQYQYDDVTFGGLFQSTVLRELASGGLLMLLSATMLSQTLNKVMD